ncbi:unnamed protein product [Colletotrichum noveboracense]|uniref:Cyanovirin-N domain-containing protein n=1 Tax=Colletotrichum noveboracense TaxID=2664923 RepID=A0A9W4WE01_9PEZI|nr:unnamed protein product [Colletotrichum noveboracense]
MLSKHLAVTFCAIVVGQAHNLEKKTGPGAPDSNWKAADFIKTCQSWAFVDNEINAQCNDTTQRPVWSRLQLGHCLVNDGGSLKARNGGNFQGSCSECAIRESTLTCECKPEPNSATSLVGCVAVKTTSNVETVGFTTTQTPNKLDFSAVAQTEV